MKQIILLGLLLSVFVGCTKYNEINTGIAQKKYPGNMYEYFHSDSYNWDSLLLLIDYTGLKEYFTGEKEGYETITFFGTDKSFDSSMDVELCGTRDVPVGSARTTL